MFRHSIKQEHLTQWLMNTLQLGPGIGDVFYLVTASSNYHAWLVNGGVPGDHIVTTFSAGEESLTADRNDVLCVTPGAYLTTEIDWDKSHTHLIGLGGPPQHADLYVPNATIYSTGVGVVQPIDLTGHYCQFHNIGINNYGANAACLAALNINGYGNYFKFVDIIGAMTAEQIAVAAGASLNIGKSGANCLYEDCNIGSNAWATRTVANSGVIRFTNTSGSGPSNSTFRRCNIHSNAATNTIAMVALPANWCIDRGWLFDQCHFNNFWVNHGGTLLQAFYDNCGTSHDITMRNCSTQGIARWYTADNGSIFTAQANSASAGGISVEATGD